MTVARRSPCDECPWRLDVPEGAFPVIEHGLAGQRTTHQGHVPLDATLVDCHKTPDGKPLACAGWLAVEGHNHLGVRVAIARGQIDPAALSPAEGWPQLVGSMAEMVARHPA